MSKLNYDVALPQIIANLTQSEKRYFKLYSKRNSGKEGVFLFITLFDVIVQHKSADKQIVLKALPSISTKQLSDLKRHLYAQILNCLSIYNANNADFKLSSEIDKARVLYNKGLFLNSLQILQVAKEVAKENQKHLKVYEIIDFEKEIESRHITRSHTSRALELEQETNEIRRILKSEGDWLEFSLKLYAKFIQSGHVKNIDELEELTVYFVSQKPVEQLNSKDYFHETLYRYQAYQWYNFIIQNFATGFKYCKRWVELFDYFPAFKKSHPHLYIKGLHNCLSVLYNCMDIRRHEVYLLELETFTGSDLKFDENTKIMSFVYLNSARINHIILSGKFSESIGYLVQVEEELEQYAGKLDDYRLMIFWYRMASIYFTFDDHHSCIRLLNKIINPQQKTLREDLQCFARLLNIITHFELSNDELLTYLIKSTYRFLLKMNEVTQLHRTIIRFLRTSLFKDRNKLSSAFFDLKVELEEVYEDPYERRSVLYLDLISWLESKIKNKTVESVIFEKRQALIR